jgi:hypothetical protein
MRKVHHILAGCRPEYLQSTAYTIMWWIYEKLIECSQLNMDRRKNHGNTPYSYANIFSTASAIIILLRIIQNSVAFLTMCAQNICECVSPFDRYVECCIIRWLSDYIFRIHGHQNRHTGNLVKHIELSFFGMVFLLKLWRILKDTSDKFKQESPYMHSQLERPP